MRLQASLLLLALAACTAAPERLTPVMRWDRGLTATSSGFAVPEGVVTLRQIGTSAVMEIYRPDGTVLARTNVGPAVAGVRHRDGSIYYIEERTPGVSMIRHWNYTQGAAPRDAAPALRNWTDIGFSESGEIHGFESIFLTRDRFPSAVRIHNLAQNVIVFEDMASYHYPVGDRIGLLVSPIDRKVRILRGDRAEPVGEISRIGSPPLADAEGRYAAWFGPYTDLAALFVCDPDGRVVPLLAPVTESPIAWMGGDLLVAKQAPDTLRWSIHRHEIPSGRVKAVYPVPAHVNPTAMLPSATGSIIGFPLPRGSLLFRADTGFVDELDGVPLSAWRFSPDGKTLYLLTPESLHIYEY